MPSTASMRGTSLAISQRCVTQSQQAQQSQQQPSQQQQQQQQSHHSQLQPAPPQQSQSLQQQSQSRQQLQLQQQGQPSQVDLSEAYRYLRRHCVHNKVENLFSSVLSERPEDPLLYIVEQLRHSSNKTSKERQLDINSSSKPNSGDRTEDIKEPSESNSIKRDGHASPVRSKEETTVESKLHNTPTTSDEALVRNSRNTRAATAATAGSVSSGNGNVNGVSLGESQKSAPVNTETPMQQDLNGWSFPPNGQNQTSTSINATTNNTNINTTNATPPEAYVQNMPTSLCSTRTNLCVLRPSSSAVFAPWATSVRSSVGGTSLDRDDSTRSDLSAFSVVSVDVQDFLQEFRSVKAECVGVDTRLVDIEVLSEILQRVNIPLPDVPLIADLFDEVKAISAFRYYPKSTPGEKESMEPHASTLAMEDAGETESRERVYFDAFISRMAFMIQGRYPTEVLRATFYAVLESAVQKKCSADGDITRRTSSSTGSAASGTCRTGAKCHGGNNVTHTGANNHNNNNNNNDNNSPITAANANATALHTFPGINTSLPPALCAAPNDNNVPTTELSTLLHGVPLAVCVEEGLWRGLGIPVSKAEVARALHMIGIPADDNYEFHVNDFVRLVTALTSPNPVHSVGERLSPWMTTTTSTTGTTTTAAGTSSIGRDASFMRLGASCREDRL
ncbi:hypothetical protein LSM04_000702 [Trypanosoma melophagium]|uniref:uncharacterized protein n=1 Tax=Trypanosoma melophagium TaxID=715481 RepID=UPI00351A2C97|nr:hypothetical protein LSM04_000702 [Trypanosoma melophagium]